MRLHNWLKPHIWTDIGRKVMIGEYACMLFWDEEERHWRVELEKHGNVGRSQLNAKEAIIDAKATLGVKEDITIPINIGDTVLGGKFKNKRIVVKDIGKNEKGDITLNGKPLMKYRIIPQSVEEMDVIYDSQGAEMRRYPKTGKSSDFLLSRERNLTPRNSSGFANTIENYYDPLDKNSSKKNLRKKPKHGRRNMNVG